MYVSQKDLYVRNEQYQDLLREAAQERLVDPAGDSGSGPGLLQRLLSVLSAPRAQPAQAPHPQTLRPAPGE